MRVFEKPSDMFRWALEQFDSEDTLYRLPDCFPQYWVNREEDGYLWQQYDRRLEALVRNARKGRRILEIGSGFGTDAVWAALSEAEVVGVDVKSAFIEIGRRMKARIERDFGTELNLCFKRTNLLNADFGDFDFIFMKDVFHHLEPRDAMVAKIASLLKPGGELLIVEPNALNPLIQLQMFRIRGFRTIISKIDPSTGEKYVYGNERLVTGDSMRRAFVKVGVEGRSERFRLLPTALGNRRKLVRIAKALEAKRFDALLAPLCVHTLFHGRRVA